MSPRPLKLLVLPGVYAVARLEPHAPIPAWFGPESFSSFTRTSDELSVIGLASRVPPDVAHEAGFRCLKVQGPLSFSEVGVLSSLAAPLAEAGVSILAVGTFETDYLLIRAAVLARAIQVLRAAGHEVSDLSG